MRRWVLLGLLLLGTIPPQRGCLAYAHEGQLHIAVTGHGYTADSLPRFRSDAAKVEAGIRSFSPYDEYADVLTFIVVDNPGTSLDCRRSPTMTRLLGCSSSKTTAYLNSLEVEYDAVIVIVNSATYGGSGGFPTVTYNGADMVEVIKHEWGHWLAGLLDEYKLQTSNGSVQPRVFKNCALDDPATFGVPGIWAKPCKAPNWYRQKVVKADGTTTDSIMFALKRQHNEVSKALIRARLETYRQSG